MRNAAGGAARTQQHKILRAGVHGPQQGISQVCGRSQQHHNNELEKEFHSLFRPKFDAVDGCAIRPATCKLSAKWRPAELTKVLLLTKCAFNPGLVLAANLGSFTSSQKGLKDKGGCHAVHRLPALF